MLRTVAIIQARTGSTRLPGKVLRDICGKSMLAWVVHHVNRCGEVDETVVATTDNPDDQDIVNECEKINTAFYRGSEEDVLKRYYEAAKKYNADIIVRICSDSPLVDPEVSDLVIKTLKENWGQMDFCYNHEIKTFPVGLDTQAFTFRSLEKAYYEAKADYERIHVTPYIYLNHGLFRVRNIKNDEDCSDCRWTVDTKEDLEFVINVYKRLGEKRDAFHWKDVMALLEKEPQLREINSMIAQKNLKEG